MTEHSGNPWDDLAGPATRQPRSLETRERSERSWQPPSMLPEPEPQDGYVFKWVRTAQRNEPDAMNMQRRLREGWEPVVASDHPELMSSLRFNPSSNGHIEVGGLILCKMPQEMVKQRNTYYRDHTSRVTEAAEQDYLRDNDERMKKVSERKRQIVFGR